MPRVPATEVSRAEAWWFTLPPSDWVPAEPSALPRLSEDSCRAVLTHGACWFVEAPHAWTPAPPDQHRPRRVHEFATPVAAAALRNGTSHVLRRVAGWLVFAAACIAGLVTVGPTQLGGPASYVIVDGSSMEPTYRNGDLVIARARDSYAVGDIVVYRTIVAGQPISVVHRIIGSSAPGEYFTQGDNRDQADGWKATDANILGVAWLRLPYGGTAIYRLRDPATWLMVTSGFLVLAVVAWARQGGPPKVDPGASRSGEGEP